MVFDAAHDEGGIAFADLRDKHTHGKAALGARVTGGETGAVIQFAGGGKNPFLGLMWNGVSQQSTIENQRNGCGRQLEMVGQQSKGDVPGAEVRRARGTEGFLARRQVSSFAQSDASGKGYPLVVGSLALDTAVRTV